MEKRGSAIRQLVRGLLHIFFEQIEVTGAETLPRGVPLVLVANHHNSLIDPALVLGELPLRPRFLAKSTLWKMPVLRRLLDAAGAIPVYRQQDSGEDTSRNQETFAACHDELRAGGVIALFPEGISHDAPHLARLKTGAARIVLEAEAAHGPLGTRVVPVGLTFEDKGRFRSRALIRVGEAIDPGPFVEQGPREGVAGLTEAIHDGLSHVTLNYPSRDEVPLVERAAEVFAAEGKPLPARLALAEAFDLRQRVQQTYERLREEYPERVAQVARAAKRYDRALRDRGLRDDHVASDYPREEVSLYVLGSLSLLLFWLPLAAIGTVMNYLPYRLCGLLAGRLGESGDLPATFKLFGGFLLFPLTWLAWTIFFGVTAGAPMAVAALLLGPASAWFAMLFHDRYTRLWDEAAAYLRLRRRTSVPLRTERALLRHELEELASLDPGETKQEDDGPPTG